MGEPHDSGGIGIARVVQPGKGRYSAWVAGERKSRDHCRPTSVTGSPTDHPLQAAKERRRVLPSGPPTPMDSRATKMKRKKTKLRMVI